MKKNNIACRLVAYTDAAARYSANAPRHGNEDNFFVDDDLNDKVLRKADQDAVFSLGEKGLLMVVADGMGGMNAGEVASQIAVETVEAEFKRSLLTSAVTATATSRCQYMEQVIRTADKNIKEQAKANKEQEGMGSTIVMAWLLGNELSVSWCGDSRAYFYNEKDGIQPITKDHSLVQQLVDKGVLTYEQTFDHPQNNIITQSLGDPNSPAQPESRMIEVGKGDVILLCSDGLSGVLRDRLTYTETGERCPEMSLEEVLRYHHDSLNDCREALWRAGEKEGWSDNVTAVLCSIVDGTAVEKHAVSCPFRKGAASLQRKWIYLLGALLLLGVLAFVFRGVYKGTQENNKNEKIEKLAPATSTPQRASRKQRRKQRNETVPAQPRDKANELTPVPEITPIEETPSDATQSVENSVTKLGEQIELQSFSATSTKSKAKKGKGAKPKKGKKIEKESGKNPKLQSA